MTCESFSKIRSRNVKKRKQPVKELQIPTKEQFRALVSALRSEPRAKEAADFVEFLAYSGLRLGEARAVRWRDVNFELNTLLVTGGADGTKNHEVRTVPLFPPLKLLEGMRVAERDCELAKLRPDRQSSGAGASQSRL